MLEAKGGGGRAVEGRQRVVEGRQRWRRATAQRGFAVDVGGVGGGPQAAVEGFRCGVEGGGGRWQRRQSTSCYEGRQWRAGGFHVT